MSQLTLARPLGYSTALHVLCPTPYLSRAAGGSDSPRELSWARGTTHCYSLKSLQFEVCRYLARQLVCIHGFYLNITRRLKIVEFQLSGECSCCWVALATPGSGSLPIQAATGQVGKDSLAHIGQASFPFLNTSWALGSEVSLLLTSTSVPSLGQPWSSVVRKRNQEGAWSRLQIFSGTLGVYMSST